MIEGALGLLLIGAGLGIHVESVEGIPNKAVGALVVQLQGIFQEKAGEAPALDKKAGACRDDEACLAEVRKRTGATDLVLLTLASKAGVAVDARRVTPSGAKRDVSVLLAGPPAKRAKILAGMVDELLAPLEGGEAPPAPRAAVEKPAEPAPPPVTPARPAAAPPPAAPVARGDVPPADEKPPKPIGVRVELAKGLPGKELTALAKEVKAALEKETGRPATLDRKAGPCRDKEDCVSELRTRVSAEDLVFITVSATDAKVSLGVERVPPAGEKGKKVEGELARAQDGWEAGIGKLIADLMAVEAPPPPPPAAVPFLTPEPAKDPATPPAGTRPPGASSSAAPVPEGANVAAAAPAHGPDRPRSLLVPGIVAGGGAVALAVGTAFGIMSASARSDGESGSHFQSDIDQLESRAKGTGLAANILFATAGAALLTAAGIYVFD